MVIDDIVEHTFSHFHLRIYPAVYQGKDKLQLPATVAELTGNEELRWVDVAQVLAQTSTIQRSEPQISEPPGPADSGDSNLGLAAPVKKLLERIASASP